MSIKKVYVLFGLYWLVSVSLQCRNKQKTKTKMKTTLIFASLIFAISCIDTKQTDAQMYIECLNNIDGTDGECQFCYDQFNKGQFLTYQDALNEANKTRQPRTW